MTNQPPDGTPATAPEPDTPSDGDVAATYCSTLVDEWTRCGVTDAVLSPGSRSTPLALALARDPRVRLHVHHDERSASFMALGLGVTSGRPAVLVCTSGTAAVQFHAAVVEAHQAFVPMLVLTADRPPELQGVGAPQTIDQRDLYGRSVRWYCEPGPPAAGGAPWWRDLARDAWVRTSGERPGPVHLNLAFREPLVGEPGELPAPDGAPPEPRPGASWGLPDEQLGALASRVSGRRGVVVAGVRAARDREGSDAVHRLAGALGWPVVADGPSRCRRELATTVTVADPLLRHAPAAEALRPEVVLRLGGLLSSAALNRWLASSGALQVGIDPHGASPDPDHVLHAAHPADVARVAESLAPLVSPAPSSWAAAWSAAQRQAGRAVSQVLSRHSEVTEPGVVVEALSLLADGGRLVVSSSMPVRDLEWYGPARDGVTVLANRGANGIDGVVSTAVGVALDGEPTVAVVGDVAALHDSNGLLGLADRSVNLVLVVVDNRGGGIFSFLPQRERLDSATFETLFGTPHDVDLVQLAAVHGLPAERVRTRAGLRAALAGSLTRGGPRVVVADSDRDANVALHREIADAVATAWDREPPAG